MQTASTIKVGAAFLGGVVLALGGAFTYFRATEAPARSVTPAAAVTETNSAVHDLTPTPQNPTPATQSTPPPAPVTVPPQPVVRAKVTTPKTPSKPLMPKPRTTSRPVSLALNQPPPAPHTTPGPVADNTPAPVLSPQNPPPPGVNPPSPDPPPAPVVEGPQPHTVTIPSGTNISVRITEKLSTDHNYSGDTFRAALDAPIVMAGFIIADRGAKVLGRITKAQKPGKFEGTAQLSLELTEVSTTDGQRMHVDTNQSIRNGPSNTNEDVAKMGGGAVLGAIIGAIAGGGKGAAVGAGAGGAAGTGAVLLGHGKPAVIENETRLTFQLAHDATITEHLN